MRRGFAFCSVLAAAIVISLVLMEILVRVFFSPPSSGPALSLIDREAPYIFSLNPDHSEISSQGFRDLEVKIPKPSGVKRLLVLGDSLAYGLFVPRQQTFSRLLERFLQEKDEPVDVVNTGVNGYTTYNEVRFFESEGARYEPDIVVLAFCFNDIANPVLHWGDEGEYFKELTPAAFPRYDEYVSRIKPRIYAPKTSLIRLFERSHLFNFLRARWNLWQLRPLRSVQLNSKRWPVYVADEDPVSLRELENPESPESVWLYGLLKELKVSVEASGAKLYVVFFPLSYQFEPGYPFFPQKTLMDFCAKEGISCLDPFEAFKAEGGKKLYLGRHRYHPKDVWHLSPKGHAVTARFLEQSLGGEIKGEESL